MGKENKDLGKQIEELVQNAIDSLDFERLSKELGNTMKQWNQELNSSIKNSVDSMKESVKNAQEQMQNSVKTSVNERSLKQKRKKEVKKPLVPIGRTSVGKTAGVLYTVFGWIGVAGFGIATLVLGILQLMLDRYVGVGGDVALLIVASFFAISSAMAWRGAGLLGRNRRIRRYLEMLKQKGYCTIEALASRVHKNEKKVLKDIEIMLEAGVLPEGHLDREGTCLIGNEELYEQYQEVEYMSRREQEQREEERQRQGEYSEEKKQILAGIAEGRAYIQQLRDLNTALPDPVISQKLYRLEHISDKIFVFVEEHPEQAEEIRRLKNYYLPTILKLVSTYQQLGKQSLEGENIRKMKLEIENTLETMNDALETMYDQLYSTTAMDVSADISVLKTMLAREGLVKDGLTKTKEEI